MWGEWEYNTCLSIPSLPAWPPFSKCEAPLRVWTQSLETCCRRVQMRCRGKFRAMALQWCRNKAAKGKTPMGPLKSAALFVCYSPLPKHHSKTLLGTRFSQQPWTPLVSVTGQKKVSCTSSCLGEPAYKKISKALQNDVVNSGINSSSAETSLWLVF